MQKHFLAALGALAMLTSCATNRPTPPGGDDTTLFVGKIITLDDKGTIAEAVTVDGKGRILKVGTEKDLSAGLGVGSKRVELEEGQVLLPGFIDPHLHILPTLIQSVLGTHNLAPCLPPPYNLSTPEECTKHRDLLSALSSMKLEPTTPETAKMFVLGMNLDPSRQQFVPGKCGVTSTVEFMQQPKLYLDACVTKDRPVIILDQSGHLAYVNDKAFEAVCKGQKPCNPPDSVTQHGGRWVVGDDGQYTGLLEESAAFAPFLEATQQGMMVRRDIPSGSLQSLLKAIQALREAGLTTIADGGLSDRSQLELVKLLAMNPAFPLRVTGVVTHLAAGPVVNANGDVVKPALKPTGPSCTPSPDNDCALPKWLGAGAIKLWVDGSTQGCTALLGQPYVYGTDGHCPEAGEGKGDFKNAKELADAMRPLWADSAWRFQLHANGNQANQWAVDAFSRLQVEQTNTHRMLLIHNTVGQDSVSQAIGELRKGTHVTASQEKVPAMDLRVTHLIGHVAYWGDALARMLQKNGTHQDIDIDPVDFNRRYGIPYSFHSDSMVTPARPLWFVEQAVTRRTWAYPDFQKTYVLGPQHATTVEEALRAITIEPARQHEIDKWVGSIEPGKVADFVVLGANPLDRDPAKGGDPATLSKIPVVRTYLGGKDPAQRN
ncbi:MULTISPECIES: amidohydrolase [unclassified Corallococcus]|uniref:amidohydrolase n=1 Tax=unclassified Corallococcus TaxID=2685029 RepID=UPI001A8EA0ED|nr:MULTISPECIES: amidohydrolase family protein [unclassified Corallococcus]MBN9684862.1 amidohydrolase family protein [Corallococcus sp. NCSPR001]WAS83674.1 amidohydrolase family protein [Corallococcus sp. NCRR]